MLLRTIHRFAEFLPRIRDRLAGLPTPPTTSLPWRVSERILYQSCKPARKSLVSRAVAWMLAATMTRKRDLLRKHSRHSACKLARSKRWSVFWQKPNERRALRAM